MTRRLFQLLGTMLSGFLLCFLLLHAVPGDPADRLEMIFSEMGAIVSATSVSARIIGWEESVGSLEPGKFADVIAVRENPLEDITALERVTWVMKGGEVYRDDDHGRRAADSN